MHTKKIAIIIFDLKGNGAEKVMLTLADWFLIKNHDCQIICLKNLIQLSSQYNPKIHIFPIKYFRWIPKKIRSPIVAFFLDKFILRKFLGNPDLILSNLLPVDTILAYSNLKNIHYIIHNTPKYDWQLADQNKNNTLKRMQKIYLKL